MAREGGVGERVREKRKKEKKREGVLVIGYEKRGGRREEQEWESEALGA